MLRQLYDKAKKYQEQREYDKLTQSIFKTAIRAVKEADQEIEAAKKKEAREQKQMEKILRKKEKERSKIVEKEKKTTMKSHGFTIKNVKQKNDGPRVFTFLAKDVAMDRLRFEENERKKARMENKKREENLILLDEMVSRVLVERQDEGVHKEAAVAPRRHSW